MRLIDTMSQNELDTLTLKGMLGSHSQTERTGSAHLKPMPKSITLRKRTKDADKKHSVIFSTELSAEADKEIVDSIYFKRPFADGVNKITIIVERDIDATLETL